MSDGKLIFETGLDRSGFEKDYKTLKTTADSKINSIGSAFEKTGAKLTRYITKPALIAGGALAALTLGKGWARLTQIDDAKVKLKALGNSAEDVEIIMENALASVKGTAYGLGEAATTAASAVASGIKPGQQLESYLRTVADTAAVAGVSMSEMGSIFNKVAAKGKVDAEILNQLSDAGVPALQLLADQLGVTTAEVTEMVSRGEVDFATFQEAMAKGVDGAAVMMGTETVTGALANIGASIGRIGANFLDAGGKGKGFFGQVKPLLVQLADWLGKVEEKAVSWGETFGKVASKIANGFIAIPNGLKAVSAFALVAAGPVLSLTGKIIKSVYAINDFKVASEGASIANGVFREKLTASQAILGTLGGKLSSAATQVAAFAKAKAIALASTVRDTAANVVNAASTSRVGSAAKSAAASVLQFAAAHKVAMFAALGIVGVIAALCIGLAKFNGDADAMAAAITGFANKAANAISQFATAFPGMVDGFVAALTQVINSVVSMLPTLVPLLVKAGIQLFMGLVQALSQIVGPLVGALPSIISAIVSALPVLIPALIQAGIQLFMALVQAIPQVITAMVAALPKIITAIIQAIPVLIPALLQGAVQLFMAFVKAIPQVIKSIVAALPQIIKAIVVGLATMHGQIFQAGVSILKKLWSGMSSWVGSIGSRVASFARSLPGKIKSGLGSLVSVGSNFIAGLWNGIKSKFDSVISRVKSLAGSLPKAVKKVLGIASPSRVMAEIGKWIPLGLSQGILSKTRNVVDTAKSQIAAMQAVYDGASVGMGFVSPTAAAYGGRYAATATGSETATTAGASVINQTVNINQPVSTPAQTARALRNEATFGLAGV